MQQFLPDEHHLVPFQAFVSELQFRCDEWQNGTVEFAPIDMSNFD